MIDLKIKAQRINLWELGLVPEKYSSLNLRKELHKIPNFQKSVFAREWISIVN